MAIHGGGLAGLETVHAEFVRSRDPLLRERLLLAHRNLARHLAQLYSHRGEPMEDLEQVASMALLQAVDRFDPVHQVAFSTYASRVITGELKRHFRDKTWAMHVPRALQELHLRVRGAVEELRSDLQRSPTIPELAEHLAVGEESVLEAMEVGDAYRLASLDAPLSASEDGTRHTQVGDDDPGMDRVEQRRVLDGLLSRLDGEDQLMVRLYFVDNLSQSQIGARLGRSQVQVSRRLARVMERLRRLAREASE